MDKSIKIQKVVEVQPIYLGVDTGEEVCGKPPIEKGVIYTGKKLYRHPIPSNYKEKELSEDLNDGTEWVLRDYGISLNQAKDPLTPRDNVMEFDF